MSDRSCAEILSLLLKHGSWFRSAIELDNYARNERGETVRADGQELRDEAVRAVQREAPGLPTSEEPEEPTAVEPYTADADVARKAAEYLASDMPTVTCARCGQRLITTAWSRGAIEAEAVVRMTAECDPHQCVAVPAGKPAPERE